MIHAMCGLVGAGKTTVAKQLAVDLPALRLTRDEWMLRLVGGTFDDPSYVAALPTCTALLLEVATDAVRLGMNVIDWNHWSRAQRAELRDLASALDRPLRVHFVDVPVEVAIARAVRRSDDYTHALTAHDVRHIAGLLEPPAASEGFDVVIHGAA